MHIEPDEPEVTDEQLVASNECADSLMDDLCEMLDGYNSEINSVIVVFRLWVHMTRYLAECGFTPDEMSKDLHYCMTEQTTEGHA